MTRKKIINKEKNKKDDLDPTKDEFVVKSMSALDWAVERRKPIGALLLLGLLVWIAIIIVSGQKQKRLAIESMLLAKGLEAAVAPVIDPDENDQQNIDNILFFKSTQERARHAKEEFSKAISENTQISIFAKLAKASTLAQLGEHDEAISLYNEYLKSDDMFVQNALMGLASSYEATQKYDEALKAYDRLEKMADGRLALWARYEKARLNHLSGKNLDKVEEELLNITLELLKESEPDRSDYLLVSAHSRLTELNPEADVPALPSAINPMMLQQLMQLQQQGGAFQ